jgi:2-polyprenyl-3-methyl-5-hydroxy-6-metoxy-1,4-benzoquinol methylase
VNRKQRRIAAKLGQHAVPALAPFPSAAPSAGIAELLKRAVRHHHAGQLTDAEDYYRQVLAIDQNHFDSLHLLGVVAQQSGRSDLAVRLIGRAIALNERDPAHNNRIAADFNTLGRGKNSVGRHELAVAYSNLSIALMALGNSTEALKAIQRSIQLEETDNTKLLFVQCVRGLSSLLEGIDLRDNLARALSEPWGRPVNLARFAANLIKLDGTTGACIHRFISACEGGRREYGIIDDAELTQICRDRLLLCLLESTIVFDVDLERYLAAVRNTMLQAASANIDSQQIDKDILRLFCALAQQCFNNEYTFACTIEEKELAERLRQLLTNALESRESIPELWLVAVAAYFPLASLPAANLLLQRRWSHSVAQLVATLVRDLKQEQQLQSSIPRLTDITEGVSLAVKQQYEESPYPRWVKASPVGTPMAIDVYLRQQFPNVDLQTLPTSNRPDILIAGCGTGQHSIETARRFKGARVLAIDLSLTSLCYAKRKTQELRIKNIEYGQADVLQLQAIGRTFDIIEASGVLHHFADPLAGWRVLLSILRPGGFMRLGLYSKLARQELTAARTFITQRGYRPSAADIRQCRQELMGFGHDTPLAKVTEWADFFSISTCRDLLFHVQEHQMTLPEIGSFLSENQLGFLGFVLPSGVLRNFRQRFPNGNTTDLALWHAFEMENSSIFMEMYEFWIQKQHGELQRRRDFSE